jgi:hypothetical protein
MSFPSCYKNTTVNRAINEPSQVLEVHDCSFNFITNPSQAQAQQETKLHVNKSQTHVRHKKAIERTM